MRQTTNFNILISFEIVEIRKVIVRIATIALPPLNKICYISWNQKGNCKNCDKHSLLFVNFSLFVEIRKVIVRIATISIQTLVLKELYLVEIRKVIVRIATWRDNFRHNLKNLVEIRKVIVRIATLQYAWFSFLFDPMGLKSER